MKQNYKCFVGDANPKKRLDFTTFTVV